MRGRKPDVLTIVSPDISELERIAHSDGLPWYQVRRARIVLGIAAGQRREDIAFHLECDDSTIWRTCCQATLKLTPQATLKLTPSWTLVKEGIWTTPTPIWLTCWTRRRTNRM